MTTNLQRTFNELPKSVPLGLHPNSWFGTVRYHVMVVMKLATREVHIAGIVPEPNEDWVVQKTRDLTDFEEGFLKDAKYLIHDRAAVFGRKFKRTLVGAGVKPVKLPPRSPNLNAYCERFIRSIKEEALNHFILVSEAQLKYIIDAYCEHYHEERPHQGLDNELIIKRDQPKMGEIRCKQRLGGLLKYYHREKV